MTTIESGTTHPRYPHECHLTEHCRTPGPPVYIGDEVAHRLAHHTPIGIVTAIYLDGLLELSTGDDDVLAADLVLLRRADQ